MNGYLLDSNVLIDAVTRDAVWFTWSEAQITKAAAQDLAFINPIIYAELAPAFSSQGELDAWLEPITFQRLVLPYDAGWRAGNAFLRYRRAGGTRRSPMPDFYIGAHAETAGLTLVTRDATRYKTYFPGVTMITP